jgi:CRP-like cAMP-binding protein
MSVENQPLKLRPFEIYVDKKGRVELIRGDGERFEVAPEVYSAFEPLLTLSSRGVSLAILAMQSRQAIATDKNVWGRYARIARFLGFLYDCGLLNEPRLVQLAEALRPDYVWRESIALEELFSLEILRLQGGRAAVAAVRFFVFMFMFATVTVLLIRFPGALREVTSGLPKLETAWNVVLAFVLAFAIGRSVRAVMQFLLIRILTGGGASLRFRCDALSISMATDDASRADMNSWGVAASFFALTTLAVPGIFESYFSNFGISPFVLRLMPFFTLLLLFVDLSPFRKSALTECLRAMYVYTDRHWRTGFAESTIRSLHVFTCIVWVVLFGLFLAGPMVRFSYYIKESDLVSTTPGLISLGVLFIIVVMILVSLLDDIISGIGDGGGSDRHSIRRLWRRREGLRRSTDSALVKGSDGAFQSQTPTREELNRLPFLRQMDGASRDLFLNGARVLDLAAGDAVCRQGDVDRTLYVLLSGRLSVARRNPSGRRKMIAYLEPGAVFGEVAFFLGDRRTADVVVAESSRLLAIRHNERFNSLDRNRSEELRIRIWFLQALVASALFKYLPADALDALLFAGQKREFKAGNKIISEGEVGDACYFIIQGQAVVLQNTVVINRLKAGDAFGEIALLNPLLLRTATVVAETEVLAVAIDAKKFLDLLDSHLPLAIEVEKLAEERLRTDLKRKPS